ncbi:MAG: DUF4388 domain-containing protein [Anaerolineales bacterium]|nr:MAG: DUF4388 domain-containing protein [Anaerolineales bacterium]
MALKGNLRDFSTTQLLNLINLARKTGALTIKAQGTSARLFFKEGKLIHASLGGRDGHLANMLLKAGKLSAEQSRTIQAHSEIDSDKELGLLLINADYVTQNDIVQSVKVYILDVVYTLFTWVEGLFYFEPNLLPSEDKITVPINLENIILEGSRRLKEWERLQDELPDLNRALRFTDRPDTKLRDINLSVEEWRVISFINPRNTIKQIAQSNNMSDFQIRKIVYGMFQAGLVELVTPEGGEVKPGMLPGRPRTAAPPPAVKRGVILRLIDRIKKI